MRLLGFRYAHQLVDRSGEEGGVVWDTDGLVVNKVILCLYTIHVWFVVHYIDIVINMHGVVLGGFVDNVIAFLLALNA